MFGVIFLERKYFNSLQGQPGLRGNPVSKGQMRERERGGDFGEAAAEEREEMM